MSETDLLFVCQDCSVLTFWHSSTCPACGSEEELLTCEIEIPEEVAP